MSISQKMCSPYSSFGAASAEQVPNVVYGIYALQSLRCEGDTTMMMMVDDYDSQLDFYLITHEVDGVVKNGKLLHFSRLSKNLTCKIKALKFNRVHFVFNFSYALILRYNLNLKMKVNNIHSFARRKSTYYDLKTEIDLN